MKIGIDLDGVVIDSETTFRTYEEIFDIETLKENNLVDREEPKFQGRYKWTKEQEKKFIDKYFMQVSRESNLMYGFLAVYNLLKSKGVQFVAITARGGHVKQMKDYSYLLDGYNAEDNVFPASYIVKTDVDKVDKIKEEISKIDGVKNVTTRKGSGPYWLFIARFIYNEK